MWAESFGHRDAETVCASHVAVLHSKLMRHKAEYRKRSLANPNRRGPKPKAKPSRSRPALTQPVESFRYSALRGVPVGQPLAIISIRYSLLRVVVVSSIH